MKKLGFIGGGNMGEALMRGLIDKGVFAAPELIASDIDSSRRQRLKRLFKLDVTGSNADVMRTARAILIAVKPQQIDEVLTELNAASTPPEPARDGGHPRAAKPVALNQRLFISIAAGIPIARIESGLSSSEAHPLPAHAKPARGARVFDSPRVIRVMPNAPAMVGEGMAAVVRGSNATRADEAFALKLFRAVGDAIPLKDETMLDAVTALSGSGPAYVYLFVKAMADAGVAEGLPAELAVRMALKTIRGAESNARQSKLGLDELIRIVASPGGTTEAALHKFATSGFSAIVADAMHAAAQRSRELGRA
jgi:pyrroline-5-carboxylate reductase